jgi:hypothetical protein
MVHKVKLPQAWARMQWCRSVFGPDQKGGNWWRHRGHLYFRNSNDHLLYLLKWS